MTAELMALLISIVEHLKILASAQRGGTSPELSCLCHDLDTLLAAVPPPDPPA